MSKILVVGSINQDIVAKVTHLPQSGETILASGGEHFFGGKGANQAIACARLSGECSFIGKIGNDSFGQLCLSNFAEHGVKTSGVMTSENVSTGLAVITVDEQANNSIVVMQNANSELTVNEIHERVDLIAESEYILIQLEIPMKVVEAVIELGYQKGKKVILNPAPAQVVKPELLRKLYAITPNENEAYQIIGQRNRADDDSKSVIIRNLKLIGNRLLALGVPNVIITLGCHGVLQFESDNTYHYDSFAVKTNDTTGAGDTFNGALVYYLSQGYSFPEAITNSQAAAALCTMKMGAQTAMPNLRAVREFVQKSGASVRMLINS